MLLPVGKKLHENLNMSFTDFESLQKDLSEQQFTGYIKLEAWELEAYLLFDAGRICQCIQEKHSEIYGGKEVYEKFLDIVYQKEGKLDISIVSHELVLTLSSLSYNETVEEISSTQKSLTEVMDMIQRKEKTGLLTIFYGNNIGKASIYIYEGTPVECIISANSGRIMTGIEIFEKIIDLSVKVGTRLKFIKGNLVKALEPITE